MNNSIINRSLYKVNSLFFPQRQKGTLNYEEASAFYRRRLRIAVSIFFFCQGITFATWASRIPDIKTVLSLSDAALGSILLALPAGQLVTLPFSGRIVARFGSRNVIRIALILYTIGLTNLALATSAWQLTMALFIFGVFGNFCNISVNTQAIMAEKMYGRPIMTSFHGVWSIAGFTGALIGLLMIATNVTPHIHFCIMAVLITITCILAQRYLKSGTTASATAKTEKKKSFIGKPNMILVQLGIIGFCSMASEGAMFDWSGVYFKQVVQAPEALTILGYAAFMIMMATGRFMGDRLIIKFGRQKLLRYSGLFIAGGLFLSVFLPYLPTATLGFLMVGLGVSSIVPMVYSAAGKVSNISPSVALASVSSISYLGFLMGPPLIGYIAELSSLRYSFAAIGLMGFAIIFLAAKVKLLRS